MKTKLRQWLKSIVQRYFPTIYHRRIARLLRRMFRKEFFPFQTEIRERHFGKNGEIYVLGGPFVGMKYLNEVFYSSATPRWLGTYEMELHSDIEEISQHGYQTIIDVGSAEGYYAVGLARRCPQADVYAFDVDPWSRDQCRRLSQINGVAARVHVRSLLKPREVARLALGSTLILCDIEGYELPLLDPAICPAMRSCDLLVEIHEFTEFGGQVESTLEKRFAETHQIEAFEATARSVSVAISFCSPAVAQPATLHRPWKNSGRNSSGGYG